ncbi:MAG: glutaminase A [Planctomycetes bacterium]|nr:glutaminase A [Planctomycetota bacterium]
MDSLVGDLKAVVSPLRAKLSEIHRKYAAVNDGALADYIPELTKANPDWFGICLTTVDGRVFCIGDSGQTFTIQSVSKPFVYGLALEDHGREGMLKHIGVEPTGDAFNSLVKLESFGGKPFNPMINAGAIAAASFIEGKDEPTRFNRVLEMFERYVGRRVQVDMAVFTSERSTGHRNRAIAHFLLNFNNLGHALEESLDLYFKQCSLLVCAQDLAMMGATLANGGVHPVTQQRAIDPQYIKDLLSVMSTCGMYDYSGEWYYRVGLAAKSGVGGGICAVVPGVAGLGVFSPLLDPRGNSVRGILALEELSKYYELHVFGCHNNYEKLVNDCSRRGR